MIALIAFGLYMLTQLRVFTDAGRAWITMKLQEETANAATMKWVAWGTGAASEAVGNTALATEASEARTVGVLSRVTGTVANDTDRCVGTITANGTKTVTECGRFNQLAVGGTMLMRFLFTGIPVVLNDQIQFTQDLKVT